MQIVCRDLVKTYPLAEREVGALNGVSFGEDDTEFGFSVDVRF